MPIPKDKKTMSVVLDPEDLELLAQLERLEKLSKSDLFRRGLRKLGEQHGVWPLRSEDAPDTQTNTTPTPPHAQSA